MSEEKPKYVDGNLPAKAQLEQIASLKRARIDLVRHCVSVVLRDTGGDHPSRPFSIAETIFSRDDWKRRQAKDD